MFVYLSKKIAIPNNIKLNCLAWNKEDGYIAVGGEEGLLKVLKLDSNKEQDGKSKGLSGSSNLSVNQTLEGHSENVQIATWNETHKKLTSSDHNGVIIVWMLYKGAWYEEMINNRKKSTVVGMDWSADGLKICIIYEDGAIIVGSVDGNRIWGKELKGVPLSGVQWSPDGKLLLFSLRNGQVHLYDNQGNFVMPVDIQCLESGDLNISVVGLDWYDGKYGHMHALCPSLIICYENGRMQLMCNESDINPITVDTGMTTVHCSWNHNGSLLAVAGRQREMGKECNIVQFYSPFGDHMRTLKVPGNSITCSVWEGGSLRVALAVDSYIYFANIRPNYKWCYFKNTVVFTTCRPQKPGVCISFWDTGNDQCHTRHVPVLLAIASCGDYCVLVTRSDTDEGTGPYGFLLCNTVGTPVDGKYLEMETHWVTMNSTHVIAASKNNFLIWQYKTPKSSNAASNPGRCKMYHIDDNPSGVVEVIQDLEQNVNIPVSTGPTSDPICCLAASEKVLIIGRESGLLQHYALPHTALINRYKLASRPHELAINCNSTRLSVIDVSGVLTIIDTSEAMGYPRASPDSNKLERRDVWAMKWASDNPQLLAVMEKTRMYVFRGVFPEEPISSSGYICSFQDLEIKAVLLDEVMERPERPSKDHLIKLEVKSLRDTRQLLEKVGINEAAQFIEDNPHPRLWRLLAEAALKQVDLTVAENAFIRSFDFAGVQFIKKLQSITSEATRKAAIAAYFKDFDEAERLLLESDRRDLALNLRQTLGDWFRVIQVIKNGASSSDLVIEMAYNAAAEYFAHFNNWAAALEYYELARNMPEMIECYYRLEHYDALEAMIDVLPEGDLLLKKIGDIFATDAIYETATKAYVKLGDIRSAIDLCILHNQWDQAVDLAKKFKVIHISDFLMKCAEHLSDQSQIIRAAEINIQAKYYNIAAKHLTKLIIKEPVKFVIIKKLYVYIARLLELHKKKPGEHINSEISTMLENAWHNAEAYHYLMLFHQHVSRGRINDALLTAYKLQDYIPLLSEVKVYSLLALTGFLRNAYDLCSMAFIKLENLPEASEVEIFDYKRLAVFIFVKHGAANRIPRKLTCFNCRTSLFDWNTQCTNCHIHYPTCIASGHPIISDSDAQWICSTCHHTAYEIHMLKRKSCPLCHTVVTK